MKQTTLEKLRHIADQFVAWQDEDGAIGKEKCPYFAAEYKPLFRYMEVPFMTRALYKLFDATKEIRYKEAADKYNLFYLRYVEDLVTSEKIAYKFGMALEAAALYAHSNPSRVQAMETHADLLLMWLRQLRTTEHGSYFLCGYVMDNNTWNEPDVGFSDDLLHVGRGLVRTYELYRDPSVLEDLHRLITYYVTDIKEGTMDGLWNPRLGTWAIGPWPDIGFEHMDEVPANEAGWVFSSYGASEYLIDAWPYLTDEKLREKAVAYTKASLKWIFDNCQFEDGAIGMTRRDDKWVGMTALGPMLAAKLFKAGMLDAQEIAAFRPQAEKAWNWLLAHTGDNLPVAGYIEETGLTHPAPGDNVSWLLAWAAEGLAAEDDILYFLNAKA